MQATANSLPPAASLTLPLLLQVNLGKVVKQLEEVRTRWDQLKKSAPQVGLAGGMMQAAAMASSIPGFVRCSC